MGGIFTVNIISVNMPHPPHFSKKDYRKYAPPSLKQLCLWGGGIFTVEMLTFSGKSAEKVMGVNGFDCPAIFWVQECSAFWGVVEGVLEH